MYMNPGKLFIQTKGIIKTRDDVLQYAQFLREKAGLSDIPPINLNKIYEYFNMPMPKVDDLPGQQGLLIPKKGQIIVNAEDPVLRQRFTAAHELMEILFDAIPRKFIGGQRWYGNFSLEEKETLCNLGGAELLMPQSTFLPELKTYGICYKTALNLAKKYNVSVAAALVNMVLVGSGKHAVVLWSWKNKPSEISNKSCDEQLSLFPGVKRNVPKRLRVEWVMTKSKDIFIPRDKSASDESSICEAATTGVFTEKYEYLYLGKVGGYYRCENWPFMVGNEWQVLSLLHLPGDDQFCCMGIRD
ncbi:ImmA/IrrE family metallo-endopeptidase [Herpetosiphon giganteus]|uniref:ImmA/IrrE family metallo-endopeptidase n=1 Tax=Herpetosiphon giganteus TaxID=2029754 RepID=UPI00195A6991|nr:ImmA/IrrE family metallo-endopeptidase [Herpetosiphon giganteus]MBM7842171.1 Zn-dependent peptidase ImmA (M78 family) [Herpetosiphon giganteus]